MKKNIARDAGPPLNARWVILPNASVLASGLAWKKRHSWKNVMKIVFAAIV
jgi:hypothetical protein